MVRSGGAATASSGHVSVETAGGDAASGGVSVRSGSSLAQSSGSVSVSSGQGGGSVAVGVGAGSSTAQTWFAFVSLAQVFWPVEEECQKTVINVVRKSIKKL